MTSFVESFYQDLFDINPYPSNRDEADSLEASRFHPSASSVATRRLSSGVTGPPPVAPPPPPKDLIGKSGRSSRSCRHKRGSRVSGRGQMEPTDAKEYRTPKCSHTKSVATAVEGQNNTLWAAVSSFYGKLLVILTIVLCATEVVNSDVFLMQYQSFFFLYLYLGSAVVIVCIYVYTLFSRAPGTSESRENLTRARDLENATLSSFGTLRKAYIQRSSTTRTSFYLRVGALVFGLATLIYTGLQISVHTTADIPCVDEIAFVHPILQAIFTFLQMHFLFVNSQVVVDASGVIARLGFMHLVATNIAIWIQMVTMDGALEDARLSLANNSWSLAGNVTMPAITYGSNPHNVQIGGGTHEAILVMALRRGKMRALYHCLHQSTLGRILLEATPFLLPFVIQFCLVAAAIFYVMWLNVGKTHKSSRVSSENHYHSTEPPRNQLQDCQWSHKGLFLGLFVFVTSTVLLVIFYVMQVKPELSDRLFWIALGTTTGVLLTSTTISIFGLTVIWQMKGNLYIKPQYVDQLLGHSTSFVVILYGILSTVTGGSLIESETSSEAALLLTYGLLTVVHSGLQHIFLSEVSRRICTSSDQGRHKQSRQIVTALLLCNSALWLLNSFLTANAEAQTLQATFYTPTLWGFLIRIALPVVALNRFHSTVVLYEIWKVSYSQS